MLIDACQSAGSGGRPLVFTFAVSAAQLLPPALMAALPHNSTGAHNVICKGMLADDELSSNFLLAGLCCILLPCALLVSCKLATPNQQGGRSPAGAQCQLITAACCSGCTWLMLQCCM